MLLKLIRLVLLWITVLALAFESNAEEHSRSKRAPLSWISSPDLNDTSIQFIVAQHNEKRRAVAPTASNMKSISWDVDLASKAKDYTKKCIFEHALEPGIGESFYLSRSDDVDFILRSFINDWYAEGEDYNYENIECKNGSICGHYTQLVWAESNQVGCGISQCSEIEGIGGEGYILKCNYRPTGNVQLNIGGEAILLSPYESGTPCSGCSDGLVCDDRLCAPPVTATTTPKVPPVSPTKPSKFTTIIEAAKATSAADSDMCYQQNKKMIDEWDEQMRIWRDEDMPRWRSSMEEYDKILQESSED